MKFTYFGQHFQDNYHIEGGWDTSNRRYRAVQVDGWRETRQREISDKWEVDVSNGWKMHEMKKRWCQGRVQYIPVQLWSFYFEAVETRNCLEEIWKHAGGSQRKIPGHVPSATQMGQSAFSKSVIFSLNKGSLRYLIAQFLSFIAFLGITWMSGHNAELKKKGQDVVKRVRKTCMAEFCHGNAPCQQYPLHLVGRVVRVYGPWTSE